ncbi:LexA family transcriptional regulator [uncultured Ruminococcus sp.]|uniref:LexA family protein n=1 Tax=uncultured Ruminococcus sp. TaxID=165186 RepID=UPI0025E6522B|nr:XRE family transcriptional regulator [uncultured Ruminococcus sp.]
MTFGERILKLRTEKGMTQDELAQKLGYKSRSSIAKIENGARDVPRSQIVELAKALGTTPSVLMGWEDDKPTDTLTVLPTDKIHMIPVFGSVAAGFGAYASSDIIEYIPLYIENDCDVADTICITVKGQSMYPKIEEGDRIVVRRQDSVDNGRIAVVMIGDEAVVKRVECEKNKLTLISINPEYPPRVIEGKDLEDVRIVGLVQEVMKKL